MFKRTAPVRALVSPLAIKKRLVAPPTIPQVPGVSQEKLEHAWSRVVDKELAMKYPAIMRLLTGQADHQMLTYQERVALNLATTGNSGPNGRRMRKKHAKQELRARVEARVNELMVADQLAAARRVREREVKEAQRSILGRQKKLKKIMAGDYVKPEDRTPTLPQHIVDLLGEKEYDVEAAVRAAKLKRDMGIGEEAPVVAKAPEEGTKGKKKKEKKKKDSDNMDDLKKSN